MTAVIGFSLEDENIAAATQDCGRVRIVSEPSKSVVQVLFPGNDYPLAYYNDSFTLVPGDLVYVSGKFEGKLGRVTKVTYNFKIRLADYKRVIAVADTHICGKLYNAGSHFVAFGRDVLPREKMSLWFMPPAEENEDEYACGDCDEEYMLDDPCSFGFSPAVADKGRAYYADSRVRYFCLDGSKGFAIVEGSEPYIVEFNYDNGMISALTCNCFCSFPCKHEFATMAQLKETLDLILANYAAEYEETGYFAAVTKSAVFRYAIDGNVFGTFDLNV